MPGDELRFSPGRQSSTAHRRVPNTGQKGADTVGRNFWQLQLGLATAADMIAQAELGRVVL